MERIKRIEAMERLLDEVLAAESRETVQPQLRALADYYFSPLWLADYAADEAGLLPPELKRGVLAEDTLYNLLTDDQDAE